MSEWPATKASRLLAALLRVGWREVRRKGSHRTLSREGWPNFTFAWHEGDEIRPAVMARVGKKTGLRADDL